MEEDKEILYLLDIAINSYIENDILRLDVSDTTKNRLKRDLRKKFRDEDFIYDIKNIIGLIPKSKVKEKIEELEEEIKPKQDIHQKLCIEVNKIGTETEYDYAMEELSILDDELREMLIKKRVLQELLEESEE